ncbi:DUF1203 domain-containing protein [Silvimonas iriomotensis]|uniref:DUF1203 domain-containing protein n=1 Tax=Silvimonas iriomotensis TaxID=449662 RepID=A0ABQ2PCY1_9NEIS|nr:DUF1203 domain-containing protein [Silvimonas iriomotensis]GGP23069.1 hypothetical protein GCM10010970_30690 [Silvimonas iriomotensis]
MAYRITGVDPAPFMHLYGLSDAALKEHKALRRIATGPSGFPERTQMRDAVVGEPLLLVNFQHQPANSPYQSSHAIFILEGAETTVSVHNQVPEYLSKRLISLRAFDGDDLIAAADIASGHDLTVLIERYLAMPNVRYLHAHFARYGCFAARVERA